ncbi:hypothetical protein AAVH_24820 [Aphelenchoides avenae]|nr:hypothetical protein AAVH_24820 [Aphelenchus avenae]
MRCTLKTTPRAHVHVCAFGQTQVPQQQAQPTPQPSGQQPNGYMDPSMASYYSQFRTILSRRVSRQHDSKRKWVIIQTSSLPQYPQGNSHMQRAPGQPPGWPSNYPNAQSSDGSYWSQQQQQQASQMAFQIQRQLSAYYQQGQRPENAQRIAHLQSRMHFLRSRMPPNAAQSMAAATSPGSGKPPSDHPHMTPQQYSLTIPPQGGPHMSAQQSAQHPMQRMQASNMPRMNNEL